MWLTGLVAPWHVGSSQTRARTRVPCIGRWILNHYATREVPLLALCISSSQRLPLASFAHCCSAWQFCREGSRVLSVNPLLVTSTADISPSLSLVSAYCLRAPEVPGPRQPPGRHQGPAAGAGQAPMGPTALLLWPPFPPGLCRDPGLC